MYLLQAFRKFIADKQLFDPQDGLLLAVSGGMDSVALCALCSQEGYDFAIAHCNFQLRAEESERDEAFVRNLASRYGRPIFVKRMDASAYAEKQALSIQAAARELRYTWFSEMLSEQKQLKWLLTAHHLDDNIETLLLHFFRGTGIAGLKGISPKQGRIIRPLLFAKKEELKIYAAQQQLEWVDDSSNASNKYTRNAVRLDLLPLIEKSFPGSRERLAANIERFRDIDILYGEAIARYKKELIEVRGTEWHIPVLKLLKVKPLHSVLYELIKDFGFKSKQVPDCINLLHSESGHYIVSDSHRMLRNRKWLLITRLNDSRPAHLIIETLQEKIEFPGGCLLFGIQEYKAQSLQTNSLTALLDADKIKLPLLLRKWKPGDYFYPLGMQKKKKLARFFIDQKLSAIEKENSWVLEMNKTIIWVVGMRIDNRYKITGSTRRMLQVDLRKD